MEEILYIYTFSKSGTFRGNNLCFMSVLKAEVSALFGFDPPIVSPPFWDAFIRLIAIGTRNWNIWNGGTWPNVLERDQRSQLEHVSERFGVPVHRNTWWWFFGILVGSLWDSRGIHLEANCFSIERGKCWVWQLLQSLIAAILVYFPSSPSSPSLSILLLLLLAPSIRYGEHAHKWQEQWRTRRGRRRGGGRATYANDKSFA